MTKSLNQAYNLPESEQLKLTEKLTEAGLSAVISGSNASDVFLELIKQDKDLNYKTKQAAMRIWAAGDVQAAIDISNASYLKHCTDKREIDAIAEEIHRHFKPRGWKFEIVCWGKKSAPFYIKTVRKDGIIKKDCVMVGVENRTNQYILIKFEIDEKTETQIGEEITLRFDSFKVLTAAV
jgi:hypothetical protein